MLNIPKHTVICFTKQANTNNNLFLEVKRLSFFIEIYEYLINNIVVFNFSEQY